MWGYRSGRSVVRHAPRAHGGRERKCAGRKQREAEIADRGEESEYNLRHCRGEPSDVETESRAGRAQQGGKERRQVHREQSENAREESGERHPEKRERPEIG